MDGLLPANARLQLFERGGHTGESTTRSEYNEHVERLLKAPTSTGKIEKYYDRLSRFEPLPTDSQSYPALGLLDLTVETNKTAVLGVAKKVSWLPKRACVPVNPDSSLLTIGYPSRSSNTSI